MNKKKFTVTAVILIILLLAESIYLIKHLKSGNSPDTAEINGTVHTSRTLDITDGEMLSQIQSYTVDVNIDEDDDSYIIAEDLPKRSSRFEIVNNGKTLDYDTDKKNELVPDTDSDTQLPENAPVYTDKFSLGGKDISCYTTYGIHLISVSDLENSFGGKIKTSEHRQTTSQTEVSAPPSVNIGGSTTGGSAAAIQGAESSVQTKRTLPENSSSGGKKIIVLDPGHGKSSSSMTDSEKTAAGYVKTSKGWGEWRHYRNGTSNISCEGSGCAGTHPSNGSCWYPIGNGDRDTEPEINLNNALNAKKYLEQMGYTVRMTRTSNNENPSFTNRTSYCYPNNDNSKDADAELLIVIHANAGGGSGSAYLSAGGSYTQKFKSGTSTEFIKNSNDAGRIINDKIVSSTSLSKNGAGSIGGEEWLIAFNKSPVPTAYLEIGFYDNSKDLGILKAESDKIGLAIAQGADEYLKSK